MAKHRLSDVKIKALKKWGMHGDGGGLYLNVSKTGTKSWIFRWRSAGKSRNMGLGAYPVIGLAEARQRASDAYAGTARGEDPIAARRQKSDADAAHIVTVDDAAERYIAAHESAWKNPKHRQQWRNTLTTYVTPVIGAKDVRSVTTDDVLRILEPLWTKKRETAGRLRGRIENILDWAKARKLCDGENPAAWRGHLKHLLPTRNKKRTVRHHPALPWGEIGSFMTELRANTSISARALELTILTAVRTSECIEASWHEFDLKTGVWIIAKERMKRDNEHRVPLSGDALDLLRGLPRRTGCDLVFPGARPKRPLSNMAMLQLLRGMRPGLTVHGFRSTFRDWAAECTNFPAAVVEMALAHEIVNDVEAAYRRGDLFEKRRKLMEAWAKFCCQIAEGNVTQFTPNAAART